MNNSESDNADGGNDEEDNDDRISIHNDSDSLYEDIENFVS